MSLGKLYSVILLILVRLVSIERASCQLQDVTQSSAVGVPSWAKEAIWYQIFPERFRNGDPRNDPKPEDLIGSWPHEVANGWKTSAWTGDWYQLQPWESQENKGFYFHAQQRRYGGDLQGVLDKLDYLVDLGINAIYLNPIFESPSLHKYDATFYHHVDNNFGPDPEGDRKVWAEENPADPTTWKWTSADRLFLKLLRAAHQRGIRVIIDGVFNHTGMTFWAFEDVRKNRERSQFKDWYTIDTWDDPQTEADEFKYEGWYGVRELPELKEGENGFVPSLKEHLHAVVKRWMDPNNDGNPEDGVDGWRLDVAEKVSLEFWRDFRRWVRSINPEAYLVGEVWWKDWQNGKMFNAAPWLQGDVFDAVMNYRWAREAMLYFTGQKTKISVTEFAARLQGLLGDYPTDANYVLMNLYDSHDTDRLGSHIINSDVSYDKNTGVNDNRNYNVRKPNDKELQTLKLMALFQMTYVGAPMIYYGTEAGMWGADDPDCRKPMLWQDYAYDSERSHPFNKRRPADQNQFDPELFRYYKSLTAIRKQYRAFSVGSFTPLLTDNERDLFCFLRSWENEHLVVALNNSWNARDVEIKLPAVLASFSWEAVFDPKNSGKNKGLIRLRLQPKSGEVFEGKL